MPLYINHRFYLELFINLKQRLQTNELSTNTAPDEPSEFSYRQVL